MPTAKQIIDEVSSLPIEERVLIVDSLLKSINNIDEEIDKEWLKEVKKRRDEVLSGKVKQ